ncbi:carbohydrate ABC transporter membrane protein 1, CUT1 family [Glycomyces sambucus]|uniref:Carbohydrate ABC transporter membrane protein 1, CUT1 family n=1 Tax=Glycomyces sambucus TaxID=380244 RepID=A0A1G9E079_9ACTN|nr:sugar ABC transporter permease [Glycomyces sambucus]SDK69514.1 carbohydrate ABC transporter membrane protein 1, CUT1 family [Glycomyces sambucus]
MNISAYLDRFGLLAVGLVAFAAVLLALYGLAELASRRDRNRAVAFVFLAPAVLFLLIGLVYPAVRTVVMSFYDAKSENFVGLDNYVWAVTDPDALQILVNTAMWIVIVPLLSTALGLVYAVLIDGRAGEKVYKALVFLPMGISFVGASIIWKFVYQYNGAGGEQIGLLNQVVVWLGGSPVNWLNESPWNNLLLMVVLVWIEVGFATVVLSAALKGVPTEIVEAARIDGASPSEIFWNVTVPSIRSAIIVVAVTVFIATLKLFDIVRAMTQGHHGTDVLAHNMVEQAFRLFERGRGATLAVLLFLLVVPVVIYQVRNMRRQEMETR